MSKVTGGDGTWYPRFDPRKDVEISAEVLVIEDENGGISVEVDGKPAWTGESFPESAEELAQVLTNVFSRLRVTGLNVETEVIPLDEED